MDSWLPEQVIPNTGRLEGFGSHEHRIVVFVGFSFQEAEMSTRCKTPGEPTNPLEERVDSWLPEQVIPNMGRLEGFGSHEHCFLVFVGT